MKPLYFNLIQFLGFVALSLLFYAVGGNQAAASLGPVFLLLMLILLDTFVAKMKFLVACNRYWAGISGISLVYLGALYLK